MNIAPVFFGKVVAVTGKPNKLAKVRNKIFSKRTGPVVHKDYTFLYVNASSNGMLSQAAHNGEKVDFYATGDDALCLANRCEGWETDELVASKLNECYNTKKTPVKEIVKRVLDQEA